MRAIAVLLAVHLAASVIGFVLVYQQLREINQRLSRVEQEVAKTNEQVSALGRAFMPFGTSGQGQ